MVGAIVVKEGAVRGGRRESNCCLIFSFNCLYKSTNQSQCPVGIENECCVPVVYFGKKILDSNGCVGRSVV